MRRLLAFAACLAVPLSAAKAEVKLIHPYPGSTLVEHARLGAFDFPEGPVARGGFAHSLKLDAKASRRVFRHPSGRPAAEVYDWYRKQLEGAGFSPLWNCSGKACGSGQGPSSLFDKRPIGAEDRVLTARFPRQKMGDVLAAVHVGRLRTTLVVVDLPGSPELRREVSAAASQVTAESIRAALGKDGHAALGDILYTPGEVALRREAQPVIGEIARLLRERPELRLVLVGHTDNQGDPGHNVSLSRRRAAWLKKQLLSWGIPPERLQAEGVGPFAPVASNASEDGRSRNRRVELIAR